MLNALKQVGVRAFGNNKIGETPWLRVTIRKMSSRNGNANIEALRNLFADAVTSVQPATLIKNQVKITSCHLSVNTESFQLPKSCYAVGFGKAVLGMAIELERALGDRLERAIVTVPKGIFENYPEFLGKSEKILFVEGAENNIPDEEALRGAVLIKELVEKLGEDDFLIVLISGLKEKIQSSFVAIPLYKGRNNKLHLLGGGSALLPLPKPPISLAEKQNIIKRLSRGGATIQELNVVRTQLSVLKGGGLAKLAYPCRVVSLILSDIVGDPIDLIASGPTVCSSEGPQEAIAILKKYGLYEGAAPSVKTVLESPEIQSNHRRDGTPVTPSTASDNNNLEKSFPNGKFGRVSNFIIGTNKIATGVARNRALEMGWQCVLVSHKVEEDLNVLATTYAQLAYHVLNGRISKIKQLLEEQPFELEENAIREVLGLYGTKKILLVFAGEPTVSVTGSGKGGRNQQLALAFALELNKLAAESANGGNISLLSAGTDGIDGPTDAAGAIGYAGLVRACARLDMDPETYLKNNDSYNFFNQFRNGECLVKTGHTGTNVMDLHLLLIEPCTQQ